MADENKTVTVVFAKPHTVVSHLAPVKYAVGESAVLGEGHAADLAKLGIVKIPAAGPQPPEGGTPNPKAGVDPKKN